MPFCYLSGTFNKGEFDPREIITNSAPFDKASDAYRIFHDHEGESIKFILKP